MTRPSEKGAVLLVDDEPGIRNVLRIALQDMGYPVLTATDSLDALHTFREQRPPIVLTDIKMPGMDGIDLLKAIKQEQPDTEVIMITGHGDMDLAVRSLKLDATDFITKPIQDEALEIALARAEERRHLKQQIREYTEDLERLVAEKSKELVAAERLTAIGQTVAGLSHSIKNIATGLKGGAFVLERGIDREDMTYLTRGWEMVKGNVDRIAGLSMDLLNYAKTAEISFQTADPNGPAVDAVDLLTSVAKESGVVLRLDLEPRPAPFRFDPEGIHRCLLNVITNAIDACDSSQSSKHERIVDINTIKTDGWGIEYRIIDNGCGMSAGTQNQIFRNFFSTKGTRGTGIGLMMTKNIIEKHKGVIDVWSKEGVGTRFTLKVPDPGEPDEPPAQVRPG